MKDEVRQEAIRSSVILHPSSPDCWEDRHEPFVDRRRRVVAALCRGRGAPAAADLPADPPDPPARAAAAAGRAGPGGGAGAGAAQRPPPVAARFLSRL